MSHPAGWYSQPDGRQRYWDGEQWTEHLTTGFGSPPPPAAGPVEAPRIRHRRNHAVAGIGFVLSGILIGFGMTQTFAQLHGPTIVIDAFAHLGTTVTPTASATLDESVVPLLLSSVVFLVLFGLLLLVTRIRYLGLVWRLGGLLALALPAIVGLSYWSSITDPITAVRQSSDNPFARAAIKAMKETRGSLWDLSAGAGLYILSIGVVTGIIASLIPAIRRTEVIGALPRAIQHSSTGARAPKT